MKTLKFKTYTYQAEKFVKTQSAIIMYDGFGNEINRLDPISQTETYTVYNADGTVGTFDNDGGEASTNKDLLGLCYAMMKELNTIESAIVAINKKIGGQ